MFSGRIEVRHWLKIGYINLHISAAGLFKYI